MTKTNRTQLQRRPIRSRSAYDLVTRATLVTLLSLGAAACNERIVGPADPVTPVARGVALASLWRIDGSQLDYLGSNSSRVEIAKKDSSLVTRSSESRQFRLGPAEIESMRLAIEPKALAFSLDVMARTSPQTIAAERKAGAILRPSFNRPSVNLKTADGKNVSVQTIDDRRGLGRPPIATMIYVEGRAVVLTEYGYEQRGKKWKPMRARSTLFDVHGKPIAVSEMDLSGVDFNLATATALLPKGLRSGIGWAGQRLLQMARPDALYAATLDDASGPCTGKYFAWAGAILLAATTASALTAAIVACPFTDGVTCAAVAQAFAYHVAAAAALTAAYADLQRCRQSSCSRDQSLNVPNSGPLASLHVLMECGDGTGGQGGGGGGAGAATNCEWERWEISYDGGETWQFFDEIYVCWSESWYMT